MSDHELMRQAFDALEYAYGLIEIPHDKPVLDAMDALHERLTELYAMQELADQLQAKFLPDSQFANSESTDIRSVIPGASKVRDSSGIHTCHDDCKRAACVARRLAPVADLSKRSEL